MGFVPGASANLQVRPTLLVRVPENSDQTRQLLEIVDRATEETSKEAMGAISSSVKSGIERFLKNPSDPQATDPQTVRVNKPLTQILNHVAHFQMSLSRQLRDFRSRQLSATDPSLEVYLSLVPTRQELREGLAPYPLIRKPQDFINTFLGPITGDVVSLARTLPGNAGQGLGGNEENSAKLLDEIRESIKNDLSTRAPHARVPTREQALDKIFYLIDGHQPIASELDLRVSKNKRSSIRTAVVLPPLGQLEIKSKGSRDPSDYNIRPLELRLSRDNYMETDQATVTGFSYQNPLKPLRSRPLPVALGAVVKLEVESDIDQDNEMLITAYFGRMNESPKDTDPGLMPVRVDYVDVDSLAIPSLLNSTFPSSEYPDALMVDGYLHLASKPNEGGSLNKWAGTLNSMVLNHLQFRIQIRKLVMRARYKKEISPDGEKSVFDKMVVDRKLSDMAIQVMWQSEQSEGPLNSGVNGPTNYDDPILTLGLSDGVECDQFGNPVYLRNPGYSFTYLDQRRCYTRNTQLRVMPVAVKAALKRMIPCIYAGQQTNIFVQYNCARNFANEQELKRDLIGALLNDKAVVAANDGVGGNVEERAANMQKDLDDSLANIFNNFVEALMAPRNLLSDFGLAR